MKTATTKQLSRWVGAAALACALALGSATAAAADGDGPERLRELEQAFWVCDYIGTTQGVGEAPVGFCLDVTRALETEKFGGDFDAMVEWWRERKPAEHARLAADDAPVVREDRSAQNGA